VDQEELFLEVGLKALHRIVHTNKVEVSKVVHHVLKDQIRVRVAIITVQIQEALEIRVLEDKETTKTVGLEIILAIRVEEIVQVIIRTVAVETQVGNPIIRTDRFPDRFVLP